jgi:hypothetical protein
MKSGLSNYMVSPLVPNSVLFYHLSHRQGIVAKLTSLKSELRTTNMTPEKPKISNLRLRNLPKWASTFYGGSTNEYYFVKRAKSSVQVSVSSVCICITSVHISRSHDLKRKRNALNAFYNFQACRENPN